MLSTLNTRPRSSTSGMLCVCSCGQCPGQIRTMRITSVYLPATSHICHCRMFHGMLLSAAQLLTWYEQCVYNICIFVNANRQTQLPQFSRIRNARGALTDLFLLSATFLWRVQTACTGCLLGNICWIIYHAVTFRHSLVLYFLLVVSGYLLGFDLIWFHYLSFYQSASIYLLLFFLIRDG